MTEPVRVDELIERRDADIDVEPDTDQEAALRFLASNSDIAYPPKFIAEHTDITEGSVNKVMTRLFDKELVDRISGRYFIPEQRLAEIRGVLGDLHNLEEMAAEPGQTPVHPDGTVERDRQRTSRASDGEVEALLDEQ